MKTRVALSRFVRTVHCCQAPGLLMSPHCLSYATSRPQAQSREQASVLARCLLLRHAVLVFKPKSSVSQFG
ncbi:hypothetical protein BDZ91DRAFT_747609 [Kalaharituber pfeilii]|nr:hypothetical protein BDZ91DRAFT_747609 [Kalaharituber pfeilii]